MKQFIGLLFLLGSLGKLTANGHSLTEEWKAGDLYRVNLHVGIKGKMKVRQGDKDQEFPVTSAAEHQLVERIDQLNRNGSPERILRRYEKARSVSTTASEDEIRELSPARRNVVRLGNRCFSPDGPFTREELDLVSEHFPIETLPLLLPGKESSVKGVWKIDPEAARQVALLEAVTSSTLEGTLEAVQDNRATFHLSGTIEGVELGARVKSTVKAVGVYDLKNRLIATLDWEQTDTRERSAVAPAMEWTATVAVRRERIMEEPKELGPEFRAKIPTEETTIAPLLQLTMEGPERKYTFQHARDWRVVGRTRDHVILRLVDHGAFRAQATIANRSRVDPGTSPRMADFRAIVGAMPGWKPKGDFQESESKVGNQNQLRIAARGTQEGVDCFQAFHLITDASGIQVVVIFHFPLDAEGKLDNQESEFVRGFQFPELKR